MFIALQVDWKVLNLLVDDDILINLRTILGNPFPKARNILATKLYSEPSRNSAKSCIQSMDEDSSEESGHTDAVAHVERERVDSISIEEERVGGGGANQELDNTIQVFIELHEGQETSASPFSIHPEQMVCVCESTCSLH